MPFKVVKTSAPCQETLQITTQSLAENNVNVLTWPAVSPDLNPIEHIWYELGCRVRANHPVNNVDDIRQALLAEWQAIPNDVIRRYVDSMRRRSLACRNRNYSAYPLLTNFSQHLFAILSLSQSRSNSVQISVRFIF